MLNPSTADAQRNDPTVRRCIGFSRAWGYGGLTAVNLFAFRATRPADLWRAADPVGRETDRHILAATARCDLIVVAWGAFPRAVERAAAVLGVLPRIPYCLALTQDGHPRHPLHSSGRLRPIPYDVAAFTPTAAAGSGPTSKLLNRSTARTATDLGVKRRAKSRTAQASGLDQ